MGKRDEIEIAPVEGGAELRPDDRVHARTGNEALDGQATDGDDEMGLEKEDFVAEPLGAVVDFGGVRDAVAAGGIASGEATADGGHVNVGAEYLLGDAGGLLEPTEEPLAGGPGKGASKDGLAGAGSLAHEKNPAEDGAAGDGGALHRRAKPAGEKLGDVGAEQSLARRGGAAHAATPRVAPGRRGL